MTSPWIWAPQGHCSPIERDPFFYSPQFELWLEDSDSQGHKKPWLYVFIQHFISWWSLKQQCLFPSRFSLLIYLWMGPWALTSLQALIIHVVWDISLMKNSKTPFKKCMKHTINLKQNSQNSLKLQYFWSPIHEMDLNDILSTRLPWKPNTLVSNK